MGVWADDRAQSIQIGAILLFGILILAFVGYQATVVPNQNAGVEAAHSQDAQADMLDVRNAILATAATGDARPASVDLGPSYPARAMFINPGPPAGTLETVELGGSNQIEVSNASAVDMETADYWDGSTTRTYDTRGIQYVPQYNVYSNAPTSFYENSLLYSRFDRASVTDDAETLDGTVMADKTGQSLVDGRKITLVALQGDRGVSTTETVSVDPEVVSAPMRTVTVQRSGGPVTVTVPTQLTEKTWLRLLDDELAPSGYITSVNVDGGELTLQFEGTRPGGPISYELRLGGVSVGDGTTTPTEKYMVAVDGDDTSVVESGSQKLIVEVRDKFNNPVSGVTVSANTDSQFASDSVTSSGTTNENGRASFVYDAPTTVGESKDVDVTASFGGGAARETVTFDIRVVSTAGGGGGGGSGNIAYTNPSTTEADDAGIQFEIENNLGDEITVETIEVLGISGGGGQGSVQKILETNSGSGPLRNEVYIDADSNGYAEAGASWNGALSYSIGETIELAAEGQTATISDGESGITTIGYFTKNNEQRVSMGSRTVEIEITYTTSSGSTQTFTDTIDL